MKKLLFLISIMLLFSGCGTHCVGENCEAPECEAYSKPCEDGSVCSSGNCVHPCDVDMCADGTCIKDPKINGKVKYHCECAENMQLHVLCCPPETSCEFNSGKYCSEHYNETDLMRNISKACYIMESCNNSRYCVDFVSKEEPYTGTEMNYFGVCNPNHECQLRCENDNDCIGENEYCHKTEKTCYEYGNYAICYGGLPQMYDMVCESEFCYFLAATQECVDYCTDDEQCPEPVSKCDNSIGNCVLPCTTDEECKNFKFSGGPLCDIGRGHCSEAIQCTSDTDCHSPVSKCNIEEGYCMIPCITDEDCVNGRYNVCDTEKGLCYRPF